MTGVLDQRERRDLLNWLFEHGTCGTDRTIDPDDFVADGDDWRERQRRARQVCNGCPVKAECRDYALYHESLGMWGGTSARQRRDERARLNIQLREGDN